MMTSQKDDISKGQNQSEHVQTKDPVLPLSDFFMISCYISDPHNELHENNIIITDSKLPENPKVLQTKANGKNRKQAA